MDFASVQLICILAVYLLKEIAEPVDHMFKISDHLTTILTFGLVNKRANQSMASQSMPASMANPNADDSGGAEPWEEECELEEYKGTFDDMAEMVLLLGAVTCFVTVMPAAPCVALVINLITMRLNARQMMLATRRPIPEPAQDIGVWQELVDFFGFLAIVTNCALIVFTTNSFEDYSYSDKFLIFFVAEYALLIVRSFLQHVIPDEPEGLHDIHMRHKHLLLKHVFGFLEDDDEADEESDGFGQVRGVVDLEAMDLSKMVGSSDDDKRAGIIDKIRGQQARLREVTHELAEQKVALQEAMQFEIMNNKTGIGETLSGLPLGCLNITIERIEGFTPNPLPQAGNIQMVISLKSSDPNDRSAPGPPPVTSKRARPTRTKGDMEFNEIFTLAPVRTHKADLYFDIMDSSTDPKRRGTCYISLAKLSDQKEKEKIIFISQRDPNNATRFVRSDARLYVKLQFKYSKIRPIKDKLAKLTSQQAELERQITMARLGQISDFA